jgi:subtilisin family serine protease
MGVRGSCCVVAAVATICAPTAGAAGRLVSVGYSAPSALHGLRVDLRVPALRTARVHVPSLRAVRQLRARPGIRFVQLEQPRADTGAPTLSAASTPAVPEWQWAAAHEDLVPPWVQAAAASVTIAVVDTGADVTVPSLAAKSPTTYDVATQTDAVHDSVGHGTFVASLAAGAIGDPAGMSGFGGAAALMIVQANRGGTSFSDLDEAAAIVWAVDHGARIVNLSLGGSQTSLVERGLLSPVDTPGATGSYGFGSGTSYAAPEIAGAAALVWAANPSLDAAGVAATIEETASSHGRWTRERAFGNVDVAAAVARAASGPPAQVTKKPRRLGRQEALTLDALDVGAERA